MTAAIDARERRARPWLPAEAPAWSFWIGPDGYTVRVNADGSTTPVLAPGYPRPGIASEPSATRVTP
jgi:hypothetical protein